MSEAIFSWVPFRVLDAMMLMVPECHGMATHFLLAKQNKGAGNRSRNKQTRWPCSQAWKKQNLRTGRHATVI